MGDHFSRLWSGIGDGVNDGDHWELWCVIGDEMDVDVDDHWGRVWIIWGLGVDAVWWIDGDDGGVGCIAGSAHISSFVTELSVVCWLDGDGGGVGCIAGSAHSSSFVPEVGGDPKWRW